MNATTRKTVAYGGLLAIVGGGLFAGKSIVDDFRRPRYDWLDTLQTDSLRNVLNQAGTARLKWEERTKDHVWFTVLPVDTVAAKAMALPEVEESFPCPPNCIK